MGEELLEGQSALGPRVEPAVGGRDGRQKSAVDVGVGAESNRVDGDSGEGRVNVTDPARGVLHAVGHEEHRSGIGPRHRELTASRLQAITDARGAARVEPADDAAGVGSNADERLLVGTVCWPDRGIDRARRV
jgi:hypothetical protein